jgi:hypothetical protein
MREKNAHFWNFPQKLLILKCQPTLYDFCEKCEPGCAERWTAGALLGHIRVASATVFTTGEFRLTIFETAPGKYCVC